MNQTQKVDDDLQKAINDINMAGANPVFPDAVAAPATEPVEMAAPVAAEPVLATPTADLASASTDDMNIQQTKAAALKDLVPIIDRVDITPSQRFHFYREYFEMLHDYSVVEPAYNVVKMITDEKERAEGLLYILDVIDNM